jgi:hypothetical protein
MTTVQNISKKIFLGGFFSVNFIFFLYSFDKKLSAMKTSFDKHRTSCVRINSLLKPNEQGLKFLFLYLKLNYFCTRVGIFMSPEDVSNLENFVKDLTFRGLIPHLEQTAVLLNDYVSHRIVVIFLSISFH